MAMPRFTVTIYRTDSAMEYTHLNPVDVKLIVTNYTTAIADSLLDDNTFDSITITNDDCTQH